MDPEDSSERAARLSCRRAAERGRVGVEIDEVGRKRDELEGEWYLLY